MPSMQTIDGCPYSALRLRKTDKTKITGRRVGLLIVFLWFAVGGLAHFFATDLEMRIVPVLIAWSTLARAGVGARKVI